VPNFEHLEVWIIITYDMPLLLVPRDNFVTLNILGRKFSVNFPTREDWSTEFVDLVSPDGLVFFTDGSLCEGRAGPGLFSDFLNVKKSCALGSQSFNRSFNPNYMLFWRVRNITFRRALSTEQSQSALIVELPCWPFNCMPCFPELYYSAEILFRNRLCLTELDWCGSLDTVVSMRMRRPTHLQERDQFLLLWDRSLVFRWDLRVSGRRSGSDYLNHAALHGA
jgi:hypothetical protein